MMERGGDRRWPTPLHAWLKVIIIAIVIIIVIIRDVIVITINDQYQLQVITIVITIIIDIITMICPTNTTIDVINIFCSSFLLMFLPPAHHIFLSSYHLDHHHHHHNHVTAIQKRCRSMFLPPVCPIFSFVYQPCPLQQLPGVFFSPKTIHVLA